MLKEKVSRRFRTLVMLACSLSILAVAFDGRTTSVKAQTHPVCVTLATTAALLSGTVDYCGASGFPQLAQLDTEIRFKSQLLRQLMMEQSLSLIQQDILVQTRQVADDYLIRLSLNE
jgi:hypothetical protein